MTRKDFELIANVIRTMIWLSPEQRETIIDHFVPWLRVYVNFNEAKFREKCHNRSN